MYLAANLSLSSAVTGIDIPIICTYYLGGVVNIIVLWGVSIYPDTEEDVMIVC